MPNWRRANCITNSARNRRVDLLARTGAKFVVNKSSSNADAFIEPVFEHPSLSLLSSRLQAQRPGRKPRLDRVQNLRRVCEILRLSFELRQQHWHCPQTSRQSLEFQNVQPGSQFFNLKENALVTKRISGLCGSKRTYLTVVKASDYN